MGRVGGSAPRWAYAVVLVIVGFVVLAVLGHETAPRPTAAPSPSTAATPASPAALGPRGSMVTLGPTLAVAVVPVTGLGQPWIATGPAEAEAAISGTSDRYSALEVVTADATTILAAVGVADTRAGLRLILADDAASLIDDLARQPDILAFLPADELDPSVRVLGWGDELPLTAEGVPDWSAWPLWIRVPVPDATPSAAP